jgi:putative ABC transport system ATP-binding protein
MLIEVHDLTKTFKNGATETPVLRGIDMEVGPGELVLLMGPSGSGKTTLISILAGFLRPTSGRVALCGEPVSEMSEAEVSRVRRKNLGFVFQSYNLFPALTALDNVAEVLVLKGARRTEARERAAQALETVGLGHRLGYLPRDLSGGQKQRVAVARALAGDPALVVGDEVTAALDRESADNVLEILSRHRSRRASVLLVTHDRRLERYADRVIEIQEGRIADTGSREGDFGGAEPPRESRRSA